jgi:hypothetical protein
MKKNVLSIFILIITNSCIDKIDFNSSNNQSQLVIEGQITNEPGPYTVKLTRTRKISDFTEVKAVSATKVSLSDDAGNTEILTEIYTGTFQTKSNGIKGTIGRSYTLTVETRDGKIYESAPERLNPAGSVDSIYYDFEKFQPESSPTQYQFRVFIDSKGEQNGENLFQWKFTGTYRVLTSPQLRVKLLGENIVPDPPVCSGYQNISGDVIKVGNCECCECWVNFVNKKPTVSDNQIISGNEFKNVEVGVVPVEYWTFYDKVQVEVKQLSLSRIAYDYWKTVRNQKDGASSLFQPAIGKAKSNFYSKNSAEEVQGLFYASAVSKKVIFIKPSDIPLGTRIIPAAPPPIKESCVLAFPLSSNQPPSTWR